MEIETYRKRIGARTSRTILWTGKLLMQSTLEGIIQRMYAMPAKKQHCKQLGYQIKEILREELLVSIKGEIDKQIDISAETSSEASKKKKFNFPMVNRVEIADSLAFRSIQVLLRMARLQDSPRPILLPMSGFINDVVEWKESSSMLVIVRERHLEE